MNKIIQPLHDTMNLSNGNLLAALHVKPSITDKIKEAQSEDPFLLKMKGKVQAHKTSQFVLGEDDAL